MKTLNTGDSVVIKQTLSCKFYKGSVCTIDNIQPVAGCVLYRLKYKDSYSWYSRSGFKITNTL